MGRKSLADRIFEYYQEEELCALTCLVIYDFENMKPSGRFYNNLIRVMVLAKEGAMLQYSCFMTNDQRAAKTLRDLVLHYGGEVFVFIGQIMD